MRDHPCSMSCAASPSLSEDRRGPRRLPPSLPLSQIGAGKPALQRRLLRPTTRALGSDSMISDPRSGALSSMSARIELDLHHSGVDNSRWTTASACDTRASASKSRRHPRPLSEDETHPIAMRQLQRSSVAQRAASHRDYIQVLCCPSLVLTLVLTLVGWLVTLAACWRGGQRRSQLRTVLDDGAPAW